MSIWKCTRRDQSSRTPMAVSSDGSRTGTVAFGPSARARRLATTSVNPWIPRTSPCHPLGSGSFSVSSPTMGLRTPRFRFSLQLVLWTLPSLRHVNSTAMLTAQVHGAARRVEAPLHGLRLARPRHDHRPHRVARLKLREDRRFLQDPALREPQWARQVS